MDINARKFFLAVCFLLVSVFKVHSSDSTIIIATYTYSGIDREAAIKPLSQFLSSATGLKTSTKIYDSPSKLIEALVKGEVNIVVPNLSGYLLALSKGVKAEPILVPNAPFSKATQYRSILLANIDSPLHLDSDIAAHAKNIKVALVWRDSTSGGVFPLAQFKKLGIQNPEKNFESLQYVGSHEKSLEAVLSSKVDLAGLALGIFDKELKKRPSIEQKLKIVWSSSPIPVGPILCLSNEKIQCNDIKNKLLKSHETNPEILRALNIGWPEFGGADRLVEPNLANYKELINKHQKY